MRFDNFRWKIPITFIQIIFLIVQYTLCVPDASSYDSAAELLDAPEVYNATLASPEAVANLDTPYSIYNAGLGTRYVCFPPKFWKSKRAETRDCTNALTGGLPTNIQRGSFHSDGPNDAFKLPFISNVDSCTILVDIVVGQTELTSWLAIHQRVGELIDACAVGSPTYGKTGGATTTGTDDMITLVVGKLKLSPNTDYKSARLSSVPGASINSGINEIDIAKV